MIPFTPSLSISLHVFLYSKDIFKAQELPSALQHGPDALQLLSEDRRQAFEERLHFTSTNHKLETLQVRADVIHASSEGMDM